MTSVPNCSPKTQLATLLVDCCVPLRTSLIFFLHFQTEKKNISSKNSKCSALQAPIYGKQHKNKNGLLDLFVPLSLYNLPMQQQSLTVVLGRTSETRGEKKRYIHNRQTKQIVEKYFQLMKSSTMQEFVLGTYYVFRSTIHDSKLLGMTVRSENSKFEFIASLLFLILILIVCTFVLYNHSNQLDGCTKQLLIFSTRF